MPNNPNSGLPIITSTPVSSVTSYTASSGGAISSDGGNIIIVRGVCWSTSPNPTISDSKSNNGSGIGVFTSTLDNLIPNTQYYVRAYASNSSGVVYGNQFSFSTVAVPEKVFDIDGNQYNTISLGSQVWMKENLRVGKYRNGDLIPNYLSDTEWQNTGIGACAILNNDSVNYFKFGKLYNWFSVDDPRGLCPNGWHVPTNEEWGQLENFLGGDSIAGGKMKSINFWNNPNTGATNLSDFSGLPGGARYYFGNFGDNPSFGYWWTSSSYSSSLSWNRFLGFNDSNSFRERYGKNYGFSVRCLRN